MLWRFEVTPDALVHAETFEDMAAKLRDFFAQLAEGKREPDIEGPLAKGQIHLAPDPLADPDDTVEQLMKKREKFSEEKVEKHVL
jgi:hypothetical protein